MSVELGSEPKVCDGGVDAALDHEHERGGGLETWTSTELECPGKLVWTALSGAGTWDSRADMREPGQAALDVGGCYCHMREMNEESELNDYDVESGRTQDRLDETVCVVDRAGCEDTVRLTSLCRQRDLEEVD